MPSFLSILREPLVHFLLAGLALFGFFAWRGDAVDPASRAIVITERQVQQLAANWARTWRRTPTAAEIDGLIRDYVKEEIYYREGLRLGLDQDDIIVRRRIRAKMEFLARSELESEVPDNATLQALLDQRPGKYAVDTRYSFDQIYLTAQDPQVERDRAAQIRARLASGADWRMLGDRIALPRSADNIEQTRLTSDFGTEFSAALANLEPGEWAGPVPSGFGQHFVRIRAVRTGGKPQLADVRQAVENDWRAMTATNREAKAFQALLDSYSIMIAQP